MRRRAAGVPESPSPARPGATTGRWREVPGALRRRALRIDPTEVTFARRGFAARDPRTVARLERVGRAFVDGYHAALDDPTADRLGPVLDRIGPEHRGFAFEGAGMALALLDRLAPWRRDRLRDLIEGPGEPHVYMVIVGAGWAWARLGTRLAPQLERLDPVLRWLALDGYGFHQGYFHTRRTVEQQVTPARVPDGASRRTFDAGLGRCLWFVCGAHPGALSRQVARFEAGRRADLWAGIGLACSYAGGAGDAEIDRICELAGPHLAALAQGAAFAAKARERAAIAVPHTRRAVERICRTTLEEAAQRCDAALAAVSRPDRDDATPVFERWRLELRRDYERSLGAGESAA